MDIDDKKNLLELFPQDLPVRELRKWVGAKYATRKSDLVETLETMQQQAKRQRQQQAEKGMLLSNSSASPIFGHTKCVLLLICSYLRWQRVAQLSRINKGTNAIISCKLTGQPSPYLLQLKRLTVQAKQTIRTSSTLVKQVVSRMPGLLKLTIDIDHITTALLSEICKPCKPGRKLQTLSLHGRTQHVNLSTLYARLFYLTNLRSLNVTGFIDSDAKQPPPKTPVRSLVLKLTNTFNVTHDFVQDALAPFPQLRRLFLILENSIGTSLDFTRLCHLKVLDLKHASFTFSYAIQLFERIEPCTQLKELYLPRYADRGKKTYVTPSLLKLKSHNPVQTDTLNTFPNLEEYFCQPNVCFFPAFSRLTLPNLKYINCHFCCSTSITLFRDQQLPSMDNFHKLELFEIHAVGDRVLRNAQKMLTIPETVESDWIVTRSIFAQCPFFHL